MLGKTLEYRCGDLVLSGYLVDGSGGKSAPGILLAHEATGLNDRCRARAERFANLGYVVLALDLYGEHDLEFMRSIQEHEALMGAEGAMLSRARSALEALLTQTNVDPSRIGAIGYCQGGITVLELARDRAPIRCAIGVHPGLQRPAGSSTTQIEAKVLMIVGNDDPVTPPADREMFISEMCQAGADWQLLLLGGVGHTFTNPEVDVLQLPGFAYDRAADERAWRQAVQLFSEVF